ELEQVVVGNEAQEADAIRDARMFSGIVHASAEPGFLSSQHEMMGELRAGTNHASERLNQSDVVLARLEISHRQNEWRCNAESLPHLARRSLPGNLVKAIRRCVVHYRD